MMTMKPTVGTTLLDAVHEEIVHGDPVHALDRLFAGLRGLRRDLDHDSWRAFSKGAAIEHPLREVIHQDPMMRRSFEKPRGYAGDAVLIDYIYRVHQAAGPGLGREIYDYATSARPASLGVQHRRRVIARAIDALASRPPGQRRVFSVAAGHFREGHLSRAFRKGELDEVVALDADAKSLAVIHDTFPSGAVRTVEASVTTLLRARERRGFDLVYSAGLYDYLEGRFATRLTRALFERVRAGGKLLLCNFVPQVFDAGFMETYMGWDLTYRTPDQLAALSSEIPEAEIAGRRVWTDSHDAVVYMELTRR